MVTTAELNGLFDPDHWSQKQRDVYLYANKKVNMLSGPVQSGKTHISNIKFADYVVLESPHTRFLLCGNTVDTVHRNVIDNGFLNYLELLLGKENVEYYRSDRIELRIPDQPLNIIWIVGVNNKLAMDRLKGPPIGGSLLDEFTTYPEEPANMALARNSLDDSRIWATMNPGAPTHWVHKRFIQKKDTEYADMTSVWLFAMTDNPTMTPETIRFYKNFFHGVFRRRNVFGEWVQAEGAIYDMFDYGTNTYVDPPFPAYDDAFFCVDYGIATVGTIAYWKVKKTLVGDFHYHCVAEWYYDAVEEGKRLTDRKMVRKMYNWAKKKFETGIFDIAPSAIYVDPSAAGMIEEFDDFKVMVPTNTPIWPRPKVPPLPNNEVILAQAKPFEDPSGAPNDVTAGIERVSQLMASRHMRWHQSCHVSIEQIQSYAWDENKREKDDAKPIKSEDHTCDRDRYGIMGYENDNIADAAQGRAPVAGAGFRTLAERYDV